MPESFRFAAASPAALTADALHVCLGGREILRDVSFALDSGRVLAVVGPNGAGKSTLFRALLGAIAPASGGCTLLGAPSLALPPALRSRMAYVPETHAEQPGARVAELAALRRSVYQRFDEPSFAELAASFGLRREARVRELSRGQRAGLVVALALAQRPDLLLLDDPTLGLDPLSRRRVVEALLGVGRRGTTVALASHDLADIERLADDVMVLADGRVRAAGELPELVERTRGLAVRPAASPAVSLGTLGAIEGVLAVEPRRDELHLVLFGDDEARARAITAVRRAGGTPLGEPWPMSFEECAISLLAPAPSTAVEVRA